jgi:glycosyltransferase involved in cell wall biosynthesis
LETAPYERFQEKIRNSYAVILVSLGDISPNMILDALRAGTPFILTRECGILDRVGECAVLVNPQNEQDIAEKILWLSDERNYKNQADKISLFSYTHSFEQISREFLAILEK